MSSNLRRPRWSGTSLETLPEVSFTSEHEPAILPRVNSSADLSGTSFITLSELNTSQRHSDDQSKILETSDAPEEFKRMKESPALDPLEAKNLLSASLGASSLQSSNRLIVGACESGETVETPEEEMTRRTPPDHSFTDPYSAAGTSHSIGNDSHGDFDDSPLHGSCFAYDGSLVESLLGMETPLRVRSRSGSESSEDPTPTPTPVRRQLWELDLPDDSLPAPPSSPPGSPTDTAPQQLLASTLCTPTHAMISIPDRERKTKGKFPQRTPFHRLNTVSSSSLLGQLGVKPSRENDTSRTKSQSSADIGSLEVPGLGQKKKFISRIRQAIRSRPDLSLDPVTHQSGNESVRGSGASVPSTPKRTAGIREELEPSSIGSPYASVNNSPAFATTTPFQHAPLRPRSPFRIDPYDFEQRMHQNSPSSSLATVGGVSSPIPSPSHARIGSPSQGISRHGFGGAYLYPPPDAFRQIMPAVRHEISPGVWLRIEQVVETTWSYEMGV